MACEIDVETATGRQGECIRRGTGSILVWKVGVEAVHSTDESLRERRESMAGMVGVTRANQVGDEA
jgi:hypothetical protein